MKKIMLIILAIFIVTPVFCVDPETLTQEELISTLNKNIDECLNDKEYQLEYTTLYEELFYYLSINIDEQLRLIEDHEEQAKIIKKLIDFPIGKLIIRSSIIKALSGMIKEHSEAYSYIENEIINGYGHERNEAIRVFIDSELYEEVKEIVGRKELFDYLLKYDVPSSVKYLNKELSTSTEEEKEKITMILNRYKKVGDDKYVRVR